MLPKGNHCCFENMEFAWKLLRKKLTWNTRGKEKINIGLGHSELKIVFEVSQSWGFGVSS